MKYVCAGLYAEGPSDYRFLLPLVDRLLAELTAGMAPVELAATVGIDAPRQAPARRADRIAAAMREYAGQCTVFIVHTDGAGDPDAATRERIEPARATVPPGTALVACVPVREIEAWMLASPAPFTTLVRGASPTLPAQPEKEPDPKRALHDILTAMQLRQRLGSDYHAFFGANAELADLRRLPAFRAFESALAATLEPK